MEKNNEQKKFFYTYSAKEQAEVKKIREKYERKTHEESKIERLRRLDNSVTQLAQAISLALGIIGTLILGIGMSLIMTDLGVYMSLTYVASVTIGIIAGIFGCALVALSYPAYNMIVKKRREQLAPEILRLADELTK